jgi:hypothetical protein
LGLHYNLLETIQSDIESSSTSIIPSSTCNSSSLKLISTYDSNSSIAETPAMEPRAATFVIESDEHEFAIDEEQDIDDGRRGR